MKLTVWRILCVAACLAMLAASQACAAAQEGQAAASTAPAKVAPVEHMLGAGTAFATPYYMINGGMHGDEPAGAAAARQIRFWTIARGKLIVLPEANRLALEVRTRSTPKAVAAKLGMEETNLNRCFASTRKESPKGPLAAAIWAVLKEVKPEWLVDLHEGFAVAGENSSSVGSSVISSRSQEARGEAQAMVDEVNATLTDEEMRFLVKSQPIAGSLARAAADVMGVHSMIAETTTGDQPISLRSRQHRLMVHRLLADLKMEPCSVEVVMGDAAGKIRVAIYDGEGAHQGLSIDHKLVDGSDMLVERIGPPELGAGALAHFDVLIMPGGSASAEARSLGLDGRQTVRQFVAGGGGYVGICAGAYLGTSTYQWYLGLVNATVVDGGRGKDVVTMELTAEGRKLLGEKTAPFEVRYANGPIVVPGKRTDLPAYKELAVFRTELEMMDREPNVQMNGSPAIVAATHQRGRAMCISPHPEATTGLEDLVRSAVRWAAGRESTSATPLPAAAIP